MVLYKVGHRVILATQGNLPGIQGSFVCIYVQFVFSIKLFDACRLFSLDPAAFLLSLLVCHFFCFILVN